MAWAASNQHEFPGVCSSRANVWRYCRRTGTGQKEAKELRTIHIGNLTAFSRVGAVEEASAAGDISPMRRRRSLFEAVNQASARLRACRDRPLSASCP